MSIPSQPTPQFGTAEYAGVSGTEHCQFCTAPITTRYYRVNQAMACPACGEKAQFDLPTDSHSQFVRGLLFGIVGAVIGLILYATFEIATGLIIGYVSLAVGFIVGKAIKMGSRGAGGRRYQVAAVILTYAAVSLAAVPVFISFARHQHHAQTQQVQQQSAEPDGENNNTQTQPKHMSLGSALLQLTFVGLASPFYELMGDPFHGMIGLVILAVGIRIAWRLTGGTETQIYGPFENAKAASA